MLRECEQEGQDHVQLNDFHRPLGSPRGCCVTSGGTIVRVSPVGSRHDLLRLCFIEKRMQRGLARRRRGEGGPQPADRHFAGSSICTVRTRGYVPVDWSQSFQTMRASSSCPPKDESVGSSTSRASRCPRPNDGPRKLAVAGCAIDFAAYGRVHLASCTGRPNTPSICARP